MSSGRLILAASWVETGKNALIDLFRIDLPDGEVTAIGQTSGSGMGLARLSPDGQRLAFAISASEGAARGAQIVEALDVAGRGRFHPEASAAAWEIYQEGRNIRFDDFRWQDSNTLQVSYRFQPGEDSCDTCRSGGIIVTYRADIAESEVAKVPN